MDNENEFSNERENPHDCDRENPSDSVDFTHDCDRSITQPLSSTRRVLPSLPGKIRMCRYQLPHSQVPNTSQNSPNTPRTQQDSLHNATTMTIYWDYFCDNLLGRNIWKHS